jgi:hypothetical protein
VPCLLFVFGCSTEVKTDEEPVVKNLYELAQAHTAYMGVTNGRPATEPEQLKQQLVYIHDAGLGRAPDEVLISPRDGLPIVVILGVDFDSVQKSTIWAYEQKGVDGKRYVMTLSRDVALMSDDEFARANFAKGHKPEKT